MRLMLTPADRQRGTEVSVQVRRQAMAERAAKTEVVYRLVDELDDVAPAALEAALVGLQRGSGALSDVPIDNALDAKRVLEAAEIAHRISRLASGQSTSNNLSIAMSDEERKERMAYLRSRIGQLDTPPPDAQ